MNLRKMLQEKTGKEDGFTLVELLVVIVILGVLSAVVVFSVSGITNNSKNSACEANVKSVQVASEAYRAQALDSKYAPTLKVLVDGGHLRDVPGDVLVDSDMAFNANGTKITYHSDGSVTAPC